MILPLRTKNAPESVPYVTWTLIGANVLIFFLTSHWLVVRDDVAERFALTREGLSPLTLLSSMFLHGDILHLAGNMWFLYLLGRMVEGRLRPLKFALLYLAAGLAGDALHLGLTMNHPDIPSLGASGAIMGVLGAAIWMFPFTRLTVGYWFGIWFYGTWEWRIWGVALYYLGFDLLGAVAGAGSTGGGVAYLAHLGGAAGGFVAALALRAKRDDATEGEAKSMLHEAEGDFRGLPVGDLAHLARRSPDNVDLALAWAAGEARRGAIPPECRNHVVRLLPRAVSTADVESLGSVVANLCMAGAGPPAGTVLRVATRLEAEGQPQLANLLLDRVRTSADASESDVETAVFRQALLRESWFQDYAGAWHLYSEHARRWPMSPMEGQVRERLAALQRIAAQR